MATLSELLGDLEDEYSDLQLLVAPLTAHDSQWDLPTPAVGWSVRDHISHLAFFDDAGRSALADPDAFAESAADAMARGGDPMEAHLTRGRSMDGGQLRTWWEHAHRGMMEVFAGADPSARVPWYGPPMGLLSFVSARLMETWAHGQDVADALGVERIPTDRLRHVAHLGVRALPFSYAVRGLDQPVGRIEVMLTGPTGDRWEWTVGDDDDGHDDRGPESVVRGPALDFCLVVTQRRNVADTNLDMRGDEAREWMSVAQAFAGPPGAGRPPAA
jgi:uncharacterized protein (TIGR03084 family)